jgi:hypothetical protein
MALTAATSDSGYHATSTTELCDANDIGKGTLRNCWT